MTERYNNRKNCSRSLNVRRSQVVFPLTREVRKVLNNYNKYSNLGLWLDKFVSWSPDWTVQEKSKRRSFASGIIHRTEISELIAAFSNRYENLVEAYKKKGYKVCYFEAKPLWRFVVGLGSAHILETGITLHHLFGLPIIPASGLKGATRAYALLIENVNKESPEFIEIFGIPEKAGAIIFFDAFPKEIPRLRLDIINPHYPQYYRTRGHLAPVDYDSPNPVFFLTVEKTVYGFYLLARPEKGDNLLHKAKGWLKGALNEIGIGAKTSVGYGYWEVREK